MELAGQKKTTARLTPRPSVFCRKLSQLIFVFDDYQYSFVVEID